MSTLQEIVVGGITIRFTSPAGGGADPPVQIDASHIGGLDRRIMQTVRQNLFAGRNVEMEWLDPGGEASPGAVLLVQGGENSFGDDAPVSRTLASSDNGRVVETFGDEGEIVALTVPPGLGRGFSCLILRLDAAEAVVRPGEGVTFIPDPGEKVASRVGEAVHILAISDTVYRVVEE